MMRLLVLAIVMAAVITFGCFGQTTETEGPAAQAGTGVNETADSGAGAEAAPEAPPATGEGTIIDVGSSTGGGSGTATGGKPAGSQQDCATLSPDCGSCLAKPGCGWCKATNACYLGDESGPAGDVTCATGEWTVTEAGCTIQASGKTCEDQYNCAFCLSGTGCKWCIQGARCAPAGSAEECFGGWLNQSYQCNYASR
jgi:hypothetical protein